MPAKRSASEERSRLLEAPVVPEPELELEALALELVPELALELAPEPELELAAQWYKKRATACRSDRSAI
jgi:hypothetical protein